MQFGDEKEALYLEAQTGEDKKTWMSWLEQGLSKIKKLAMHVTLLPSVNMHICFPVYI